MTQKYEYQKTSQFFAQISNDIIDLGAEELNTMKAGNIQRSYRGIYFEADLSTMYRLNYTSRFFTRILAPLAIFPCHSTRYLYSKAKEISWEEFFSVDQTFAISANVVRSKITHSQYAALCLKDAIVDYFRDKFGKRPSVERISPDIWFTLHIEDNLATIALDTSGGSLHRRGYREQSVEAPMQETVAAAIIQLAGWDGSKRLHDPMCGSGTLLCEALMYHCRIPSGYLRAHFGFEALPEFIPGEWNSLKNEINNQIRELGPYLISGSDLSPVAVEAAQHNLRKLPSGSHVNVKIKDFHNSDGLKNALLITNPPYGIRLGQKKDVIRLYHNIGNFLKKKCSSVEAYLYCGDREIISEIGLKPVWKKPLRNGGLDGRLVKFEIKGYNE